jgi:hypothetical protein
MLRLSIVAAGIAFGVALAAPASAQDAVPFAHVSYTEGRVLVEHEATTEEVDGNTPLVAGDRLRTEDGRAEVLFGDGSLVQLDQQTTMDVLSDALVRVMSGRVIVRATSTRAGQLQIDTPAGSVFLQSGGEYHIGLVDTDGQPTLDLAVVRGRADLATDVERLAVDTGQRAWARLGEAPSYPVAFNSAQLDPFAEWAAARIDARRGEVSYQYVAAPLRPYAGILDTYGSWGYQAPYGYVWYPRVDVGWRPYYHGRWRFYASIGWTWIGGGVWAWPTHHYGRWGISGARWFWIPGRTWGAGYVHWAVAPGYVSWCPLGFNNRPIFAFHHYGRSHGFRGHGYDGWRGWTFVPRRHFGTYRSVSRVAVDGRTLFRANSRQAFVERAPAPRSVTALRRADGGGSFARPGAGVAVPRGTASFDRSGARAYSAGPSVRGSAIRGGGEAPRTALAPGAGRTRSALAQRDGGYIATENGSRVYRVPSAAAPRSTTRSGPATAATPDGSRLNGTARSRTAPDNRGASSAPRNERAFHAPFAGAADGGDAQLRRTAPIDRGSYAVPRGEAAARARTPSAATGGGNDARSGRTAPAGRTSPADRGSYAPRNEAAPRATAPYGAGRTGGDPRVAPSYRSYGAPRPAPGSAAPSREMPGRTRSSGTYEGPGQPAVPRGYQRDDGGRSSGGAHRGRPEGTPRMSQPAPRGGSRGSAQSYAPPPRSGSGGSGMRQAPSGARHGGGSAREVPRGGRRR